MRDPAVMKPLPRRAAQCPPGAAKGRDPHAPSGAPFAFFAPFLAPWRAARLALRGLGPVLAAAAAFTAGDISGKVALTNGTDVLSLLAFRGVTGTALVFVSLRLVRPRTALAPRMALIAAALGLLLAANMAGLFEAIALVPVSIAILTYFVYPLMTGIAGAVTGIDRLTRTGAAAALAAFGGLALIIGAHPAGLALAGLLAAAGGAACRAAILLITRAALKGADPRLVTWYTLLSSTLAFIAAAALSGTFAWPHGAAGWAAFSSIGVTTTIGVFALYVSAQRIGPFRTAVFMNLEPLMTSVLGALLLGERLTPLQALGGLTMLAALSWFQMRGGRTSAGR